MAEISAAELKELRAKAAELEEVKAASGGPFEGVALCVNRGCEDFDTSKPIALIKDIHEDRNPDFPEMVLRTSEHLRPVDDADLACPTCSEPRSIAETAPPTYQALAPR